MKKNYRVGVRVHYTTYLYDNWYNEYEWFDMHINDIEYDEIEDYVKTHRPKINVCDDQQYRITNVTVDEIYEVDENGDEHYIPQDDSLEKSVLDALPLFEPTKPCDTGQMECSSEGYNKSIEF